MCTGFSSLVPVRQGKLPVWYLCAADSCQFGLLKTRVSSTVTGFKILFQFGTFVHLNLPIQYPLSIFGTLVQYNMLQGRKFKFELRGYALTFMVYIRHPHFLPIQYLFVHHRRGPYWQLEKFASLVPQGT